MRLGILRNRASTGNRGRPPPTLPPGAALAETDSPTECRESLERLRAAGAEALVIDGGDGTLRAAVTDLEIVFGAAPPPLAICASGNTNLVARNFGAIRGAEGIARLAAWSAEETAARSRPCPVLRIAFSDRRPDERGFIAGWGAYFEATRIGAEEIAMRHRAQVVGAVASVIRRSLGGPDAIRLRQGIACDFRAEGHPEVGGRRFLGVVTSLPGPLIRPLDPFWGRGEGPIRWLDIAAPPRRLALAAPLVAIGRPMRWMEAAGYRSGRTGRIELTLSGDMVVDGERMACGGAVITAGNSIRLIRP